MGDFIDVQQVLEADWQREAAEVRALEHDVALPDPDSSQNDADLLRQWIRARRSAESGLPGQYVVRLLRSLSLVLVLLAIILGTALAKLVFYYDGAAPVNIVKVIAVLVFFPLLLLIPSLFAMGPRRLFQKIPGIRGLHNNAARYSPGSLLLPALRSLPEKHEKQLERIFGIGLHGRALYQDTALWLVLHLGQVFSVWFYGAVCCTALYLIVFSDLAFAWSTTLNISEYTVHQLTSALAAPWKSLLPDAVPSLELIQSSRFYRLQPGLLEQDRTGLEVNRLGEWWAFILCAIVVYSFLPRVVLLIYTRIRLARILKRSLLTLPGSQETLARLKGEWIPLGAKEVPAPSNGRESAELASAQIESALPLSACHLISWGDLNQEALNKRLHDVGLTVIEERNAGGNIDLEAEQKIILELSRVPEDASIVIATKRWEPPGGELLDFLSSARAQLSKTRLLYVAPFSGGVLHGEADALNNASQLRVWQKVVSTLGDPWLRIIDLEKQPEA